WSLAWLVVGRWSLVVGRESLVVSRDLRAPVVVLPTTNHQRPTTNNQPRPAPAATAFSYGVISGVWGIFSARFFLIKREAVMRKAFGGAAAFVLLAGVAWVVSPDVAAQSGTALAGVVSSKEEGKMEGVVVNARREGATFTVSVVSDDKGKYSFPRTHLEPGNYTLTIRAVGYELTDPGPATVAAGKTAKADLALTKAKDLGLQLTSTEWAHTIN